MNAWLFLAEIFWGGKWPLLCAVLMLLTGLQGLPAAFVHSAFARFLDDARTLEPGAAAAEAVLALMALMNRSYVDTTTATFATARELAGVEGEERGGEDARIADFRNVLLKFFRDVGLTVRTLEPFAPAKASCICSLTAVCFKCRKQRLLSYHIKQKLRCDFCCLPWSDGLLQACLLPHRLTICCYAIPF